MCCGGTMVFPSARCPGRPAWPRPRDRGDRDRRKVLIYLTEAARGLEREYNAVSEEISNIYYKGFTKAEIAQLEGYLERVLKNVEEAL